MVEYEKVPVYYVAHPLGHEPQRSENVLRVKRWMAWLIQTYPDISFCCPWLPYAECLPEGPDSRHRGLRDDLSVLAKCDGIVLCGGTLSHGMAMELDYARHMGLDELHLLQLGPEPL